MARIERTNEKHSRAQAKQSMQERALAEIRGKSWYCDQCHVEVYQLRCRHCGKLEREPK